jgi:hypothetical protein
MAEWNESRFNNIFSDSHETIMMMILSGERQRVAHKTFCSKSSAISVGGKGEDAKIIAHEITINV